MHHSCDCHKTLHTIIAISDLLCSSQPLKMDIGEHGGDKSCRTHVRSGLQVGRWIVVELFIASFRSSLFPDSRNLSHPWEPVLCIVLSQVPLLIQPIPLEMESLCNDYIAMMFFRGFSDDLLQPLQGVLSTTRRSRLFLVAPDATCSNILPTEVQGLQSAKPV
ncbi:hypothetical protein EDC04DRAFT_2679798 [Pisolithus marmoratus]|nr:hypothetical protein EDC04DRAFT_2679798 [Pisolithus marmoratus]